MVSGSNSRLIHVGWLSGDSGVTEFSQDQCSVLWPTSQKLIDLLQNMNLIDRYYLILIFLYFDRQVWCVQCTVQWLYRTVNVKRLPTQNSARLWEQYVQQAKTKKTRETSKISSVPHCSYISLYQLIWDRKPSLLSSRVTTLHIIMKVSDIFNDQFVSDLE